MANLLPETLASGYRAFRSDRFVLEERRYRDLAAGQSPEVMVVGCADSRVDPATIFSAAPGELFVVRNVAGLVPPYEEAGTYHGTSAALEFAVTVLRVKRILVMGHGMCGGIAAALEAAADAPVGQFIGPWVGQLGDLCRDIPGGDFAGRQRALEHASIRHSLQNLATFPFVREAVAAGALDLHGAWFSIAEGELHALDPLTGRFETVPERA